MPKADDAAARARRAKALRQKITEVIKGHQPEPDPKDESPREFVERRTPKRRPKPD